MSSTLWRTLSLLSGVAVCLLGSSCSDSGGGGTNSPGSDGGTPTAPSGFHRLKIEFDVAPGVANVRVAYFLDKGNVGRSTAGDPIQWTDRATYDAGGTSGGNYVVPHGAQVVLVCDENEAISSPANTGVDPVPSVAQGQFLDWQGDTQGATGGDDAGILNFTMNEDRTITARFGVMSSVVIRSLGGAQGTGTAVDIDIGNQTSLTIPPRPIPNSKGVGMVGTGLTGQQGKIGKFHFFRDGTTIKFTVPASSPFTAWSGDGQIGGRTVTFKFGEPGKTAQTAELNWP